MQEDIFLELEMKLQSPKVRKEVSELDMLVTDDLYEITSSGKATNKKDCLVNLPAAPEMKFEMSDFIVKMLAPGLVQTLFKTKKTIVGTGSISVSMRSSI